MPGQPMHARSVNMQDIYVNIGSLRSTVLDFGQLALNPDGRSCPGCVRCRFLCKKDEHRNSLIFGQNATLLASIAACGCRVTMRILWISFFSFWNAKLSLALMESTVIQHPWGISLTFDRALVAPGLEEPWPPDWVINAHQPFLGAYWVTQCLGL